MCGRFSLALTPDEVRTLFDLPPLPPSPDPSLTDRPRFNVAPTQPILAVASGPHGREGQWPTWGFLPAKPGRPPLINARAETALSRPGFAEAVRSRRGIVVADGFFEWARAGKRKQPYFIHPWGGGVWTFAAILNPWKKGGLGVAIITVAANEEVAPLHDRMPLVLPPEQVDAWLDPTLRAEADIRAMLEGGREGEVALHPVSPRVGAVANDDPGLVEPIELPPEPAEAAPPPKKDQLGFDW
jgi:putative SOS response-associated peptidase YedK